MEKKPPFPPTHVSILSRYHPRSEEIKNTPAQRQITYQKRLIPPSFLNEHFPHPAPPLDAAFAPLLIDAHEAEPLLNAALAARAAAVDALLAPARLGPARLAGRAAHRADVLAAGEVGQRLEGRAGPEERQAEARARRVLAAAAAVRRCGRGRGVVCSLLLMRGERGDLVLLVLLVRLRVACDDAFC